MKRYSRWFAWPWLWLILLAGVGIYDAGHVKAASPTLISRGSKPLETSGTSPFGGPFEFVSQAVPTMATDVSAVTSHITGMWVHNPTGGSSITLTFKDKQGTPQALPLDGQVITAGQDVVFNAPFGVLAQGGMTITASGAGLSYEVVFTH